MTLPREAVYRRSGRIPHSVLAVHERTAANAGRGMDAEVDALIEEITVDCHDEDEQLSAF
jgi:hypothetical protein